jgi:hypothetical protein
MLVLKRLLLNREYVVINALEAFASIVSMCDLHVFFLSNITPRYFILHYLQMGFSVHSM